MFGLLGLLKACIDYWSIQCDKKKLLKRWRKWIKKKKNYPGKHKENKLTFFFLRLCFIFKKSSLVGWTLFFSQKVGKECECERQVKENWERSEPLCGVIRLEESETRCKMKKPCFWNIKNCKFSFTVLLFFPGLIQKVTCGLRINCLFTPKLKFSVSKAKEDWV